MDLLELAKVSVCRRVESINPSVRGSKDLISHILRELHPAAPDTRSSWLLTLRGPPPPISQVLFDLGMIWLWFIVLSYLYPNLYPLHLHYDWKLPSDATRGMQRIQRSGVAFLSQIMETFDMFLVCREWPEEFLMRGSKPTSGFHCLDENHLDLNIQKPDTHSSVC